MLAGINCCAVRFALIQRGISEADLCVVTRVQVDRAFIAFAWERLLPDPDAADLAFASGNSESANPATAAAVHVFGVRHRDHINEWDEGDRYGRYGR